MNFKYKVGDVVLTRRMDGLKNAEPVQATVTAVPKTPGSCYVLRPDSAYRCHQIMRLEAELQPNELTDAELAAQYREHRGLALEARQQLEARGFIFTINGRSLNMPLKAPLIHRPEERETVVKRPAVTL